MFYENVDLNNINLMLSNCPVGTIVFLRSKKIDVLEKVDLNNINFAQYLSRRNYCVPTERENRYSVRKLI